MTARRLRLVLALPLLLAAAAGEAGEVRVITAPGLTPPPRFETSPQRVEPPSAAPRPAGPIVERRIGPVVVEDAATLVARRLRIRLPGIAVSGAEETCRDTAGVEHPCGRRALAGLRALLRLRPVTCPLPADARAGLYEARCAFLSGGDVGEAFVASGWARAAADGPYAAAEAAARTAERGLWGPLPSETEPAATAIPEAGDFVPPPDVTTAPLPGGRDEATPTTRAAAVPGAADPAGAPMRLGR